MADALEKWAAAAAEAVDRTVNGAVADRPLALVHVVMPGADAGAPNVKYAHPSADRAALREWIFGDRYPGGSVRKNMSAEGLRAFDALGEIPVSELVDALQAELDAVRWPVLVTGSHDAVERAQHRFSSEQMDELFGPEPPLVHEGPTVDIRPVTREELVEMVAAFELPDRLAALGRWGLALVPGGIGVSRIGGRPDLPDGEWPLNDGRGLTHLATIALSELPEIDGREDLPPDGTLVFFADFSEESEGWGPARGDESVIRIVHVPADTATRTTEPPDEPRDPRDVPVEIGERRVRFEPVLTLPLDAGDLPSDERAAYQRLTDQLCEITPGLGTNAHLMLGHPTVVQEDPRAPGEINLLHLDYDEELGFMYGDAGDVTFYGTAEDIRAARWDRIKAIPNSS
jgi:hypothetical protein